METKTDKWINPDNGTVWATSRSGKIRIACGQLHGKWQVWALYAGTHDLAPVTRNFDDEQKARDYANQLWRTR